MLTLQDLKEELEPYKDTLVINAHLEIVRLAGVIENPDDFYWSYDSGEDKYYSSAVMSWIPLKKFLSEKDYDKIINVWNMNYTPKVN